MEEKDIDIYVTEELEKKKPKYFTNQTITTPYEAFIGTTKQELVNYL